MSMDSATSGSLQSSSGGGGGGGGGGGDFDEFDSRPLPDSIPSFPNLPPTQHRPPPVSAGRLLLNPLASYLTTSFPTDLDAGNWPRTLTHPSPPVVTAGKLPCGSSSASLPPAATLRGSKKRARASRRAPTTVLTTDTSNFRAMVQEFTGIPEPPFVNSSFSRSRLDLLQAAASSGGGSGGPPAYLFQPFVQKLQAPRPSFPSIYSTSPSSIKTNIAMDADSTNPSEAAASLPPASGLQNPYPIHGQNPILNLESLLQQQQQQQQQQPADPPWPGGYAGGELGSVLVGTSVDGGFGNLKRIRSCKSPSGQDYHAEKQIEDAFPSTARGGGVVDPWQLSSD